MSSVRAAGGWIQSRQYDLSLIALPPLIGFAICAVYPWVDGITLSGFSLFLFGMPHYISTYSFYFGDDNRAYHRSRWFAFYAGPFIVIAFLTLGLLYVGMLVAFVVDAWNVYHVSRQSSGILSIYRHINKGDNRIEKIPANLALMMIAYGLYCLTIEKQPSFAHYLGKLPVNIMPILGPAMLTVGGIALAFLLWRLASTPRRLFSPEGLFLVTSALLFLPYAILPSRATATTAMLTGHYIQYMGLLWLLNHRKYTREEGMLGQRVLAKISTSVPRIVILLASIVALTALVDRVVHRFDAVALHSWILNIVVLLHFYLDGLFWAFKHRHTRETVGSYLLTPREPQAEPSAVPVPAT
jgi:hypothetical protein